MKDGAGKAGFVRRAAVFRRKRRRAPTVLRTATGLSGRGVRLHSTTTVVSNLPYFWNVMQLSEVMRSLRSVSATRAATGIR